MPHLAEHQKQSLKVMLLTAILGGLCVAVGAALLSSIFAELSLAQAIAAIVYPLLIGYLISAQSTSRILLDAHRSRDMTAEALERIMALVSNQVVPCHGTKYHVPNREVFWNNLLEDAKQEFILVGNTNKSWIKRDPDQSRRLGAAIINLLSNGGSFTIVSGADTNTIADTKEFLATFVHAPIDSGPKRRRMQLKSALREKIRYAVTTRLNYSAVVSDDRMLIIPRLNTPAFNAEAMVLELRHSLHPTQFQHYHDDIERVATEGELRY